MLYFGSPAKYTLQVPEVRCVDSYDLSFVLDIFKFSTVAVMLFVQDPFFLLFCVSLERILFAC